MGEYVYVFACALHRNILQAASGIKSEHTRKKSVWTCFWYMVATVGITRNFFAIPLHNACCIYNIYVYIATSLYSGYWLDFYLPLALGILFFSLCSYSVLWLWLSVRVTGVSGLGYLFPWIGCICFHSWKCRRVLCVCVCYVKGT